MTLRLSIIVLLICSLSFAQTNPGAKPATKTTVIKAARMFDGKSDRVTSPGLIIVTDGKIQAVGASAQMPAGAEVIDLGDATLLPGFMDAHTHMSGEASDDWRQDELDALKKPVTERALDATEYAR
ncbi:MAG: amidohydrolase family protein, partial [Acidobacteriota bacterium]|nr:amidohydrolase family protein [Acidobacteriota bacterium]